MVVVKTNPSVSLLRRERGLVSSVCLRVCVSAPKAINNQWRDMV